MDMDTRQELEEAKALLESAKVRRAFHFLRCFHPTANIKSVIDSCAHARIAVLYWWYRIVLQPWYRSVGYV